MRHRHICQFRDGTLLNADVRCVLSKFACHATAEAGNGRQQLIGDTVQVDLLLATAQQPAQQLSQFSRFTGLVGSATTAADWNPTVTFSSRQTVTQLPLALPLLHRTGCCDCAGS